MVVEAKLLKKLCLTFTFLETMLLAYIRPKCPSLLFLSFSLTFSLLPHPTPQYAHLFVSYRFLTANCVPPRAVACPLFIRFQPSTLLPAFFNSCYFSLTHSHSLSFSFDFRCYSLPTFQLHNRIQIQLDLHEMNVVICSNYNIEGN